MGKKKEKKKIQNIFLADGIFQGDRTLRELAKAGSSISRIKGDPSSSKAKKYLSQQQPSIMFFRGSKSREYGRGVRT